jgi:hypothetical protein
MDIGQNIFLGRWPRRFGVFVDRARMYREANAVLQRLKVDVNSVYSQGREPVGRAPAIGRDRARDLLRSARRHVRRADGEPLRHGDQRLLETMSELKRRVSPRSSSRTDSPTSSTSSRSATAVMVLKRGERSSTSARRVDLPAPCARASPPIRAHARTGGAIRSPMRLFINPRVDRASPYPQSMQPILSLAAEDAARREISSWPGYAPRPTAGPSSPIRPGTATPRSRAT